MARPSGLRQTEPDRTTSEREAARDVPWHSLPADEVAALLESSTHGLSTEEAARRLASVGPNELRDQPPPSAIVLFLRQFASTFIVILIVAAVITLALGELLDTALIAVALLLNAVIGFVQERRAASAVRALMKLVVPHARVVRDGHEWEIDSRELVPGDLVVLESGSRVPADLRLIGVNELTVDESLLTGESLPVPKDTAPVGEDAVAADRSSMAFTGTIVANGRGRGLVVATGDATELGSIAGEIRGTTAGELPLQARMATFARVVGFGVVIASVVAFASGVALGNSASEMFHVAVAMAVSAVPEGLPVAVTVTLAIGVTRMARRHAVLRQLPALETLGSTTVVGSDKTGTLTENRMTVESIWAGGRRFDVADGLCDRGDALRMTLTAGVLTNEAEYARTDAGPRTTGDPTEVALLVAADAAGIEPGELRDRHRLVADIPFESHLQYSASIREWDGGRAIFVKGAPERVVRMCTSYLRDDGIAPLDRDAVLAEAHALASDGLRVLAMAYRPLHPEAVHPHPGGGEPEPGERVDPDELVFLGLQGMLDPPRAGVRDAIAACHDAGVDVIMITGDHAVTAAAIGRRLGILHEGGRVLTGADLAQLDDRALREATEDARVFARVSPNDKLRIVRALQDRGHVVAVTGDGVNDAPALRAAAIGVAMGEGGTDVAREASEMVLSDDNFVSIVAAIEEGRIAFANIRKVSFFLISTALAETAAILVSVWMSSPLLLVPAQILWLNLVTNGVQDLALAFEPGSPDVLKRPPRPPKEGVLSATMWERTAIVGVVMAAGALVMFNWALDRWPLETARSVALTTLVMFNIFQAGNARSENRSLFTLNPMSNRLLFWSTLGATVLHVAALYLPPTRRVLGITPISGAAWIRAILVASTVLVVIEVHKAVRRRWPLRSSRPADPAARAPRPPATTAGSPGRR